MSSNRITTLPHKLKALTDDPSPNIRAIYAAAVNAQIPAYQINAIWHYDEPNLPAIMAHFGLRPKAGIRQRTARPGRALRLTNRPHLRRARDGVGRWSRHVD